MGKLAGKVAVITGGTTGIGLATARLFLAEGAKVVVTGRQGVNLAAAREALPGALVIAADQSRLEDVDALVAAVRAAHDKVDVLFVNAGVARFKPIEEVDEAAWDETMAINVKGAFFTVQKFLPLLGKGGSVVFNTSAVEVKGFPSTSAYAASKAALRSLARTLATKLAPRGVRVNAVSPGPIETPIYAKLGLPAEAVGGFKEQMAATIALRRFGQAEEAAKAVLFLASDDASFVVGESLAVDGGLARL